MSSPQQAQPQLLAELSWIGIPAVVAQRGKKTNLHCKDTTLTDTVTDASAVHMCHEAGRTFSTLAGETGPIRKTGRAFVHAIRNIVSSAGFL